MSFCCISQDDPPSPESLPPRPIEQSKDAIPVPSWSTPSRLSKPEDAAELHALFKDGDSDIDGEEHRILEAKKSSSTLDAVKSKLRKHLSRELTLSKHRPRSTVGHSEEEIERRKELRLIRDRRIQEELSSEGAYDDDARSFSTLATAELPSKTPWPPVVVEHMNLPDGMKTGPPQHVLLRNSDDDFHLLQPPMLSSIKQRHSLAVLDKVETLVEMIPEWAVRRRSSVCPIPSTPMLEPQSLPSTVDPATRQTSWRLSFTADQRSTQLRALSQEHRTSPPNADSVSLSTSAGPLRWFQGQVSRHFAATNLSAHPSVLEKPVSQATLHPDPDDYEGVDGNAELLIAPVSLYDMQISQRLASRGLHSHSSSPQLSSWGSQFHYRGLSLASSVSNQNQNTTHHHTTSSSGVTDSKNSTNLGDILRDGVSSLYPSAGNSIRLTSESSRFGAPSLFAPKRADISSPGRDSQGAL
jgi:hypothetical protein